MHLISKKAFWLLSFNLGIYAYKHNDRLNLFVQNLLTTQNIHILMKLDSVGNSGWNRSSKTRILILPNEFVNVCYCIVDLWAEYINDIIVLSTNEKE